MSGGAWADVAGPLEQDLAVGLQHLGAPALTGPLLLHIQRSFFNHLQRETFADPRCTPEVKQLVWDTLTGRPT